MAYVTQADLVLRFGQTELAQLTDRDGTAGAIVSSVLDSAIADAGAIIDAHLEPAGYTVPISPIPAVIVRIAADLARYFLYALGGVEDKDAPWVKRYNDAVRLLEKIMSGDVLLGVGVTGTAGTPDFRAPERIFSRDDIEGF